MCNNYNGSNGGFDLDMVLWVLIIIIIITCCCGNNNSYDNCGC